MRNVDIKVMVSDNMLALIDETIAKVESGERGNWRKPWSLSAEDTPVNFDGIPYRGINTFILSMTAATRGYKSNVWLTFRKVGERGGKVRKGEHGTMIVFWKRGTRKAEDEDGNEVTVPTFLLRYYKVWNLDQTEGVKVTPRVARMQSLDDNADNDAPRVDDAEALLASYLVRDDAPTFREGGNRAFYMPDPDVITIPPRKAYTLPQEYYSTAFHEVGHSTGHSTRCKREGIIGFDHFGSDKYGAEELVAEMTGALCCAYAGIEEPATVENMVEYLTNWAAAIKANKSMLVDAAGKAQRAFDYIVGVKYDEA